MNEFKAFRHISTGVIEHYPAHFANHPVFGPDLEEYLPGEYEVDKVALEDHELPVDQRGVMVAVPLDEMSKDELVAAAESHGLDSKGTKADLIARLSDHNNKEEE